MLAMSTLCPTTLGWEYPLELDTNQEFDNFDFDIDSMFLANVSSSQAQDCGVNTNINQVVVSSDHAKQSESPQGTSSTDQFDNNPLLSKKLNHNASERDRRKKINDMYSSLRALLPAIDHSKKLSIPATIGRVLEYIPQLQKEVEKLSHKKEVFLSKISALQGNVGKIIQEENPKKCVVSETTSCSISSNKLGDKEMVIQISTVERLSICEVLLVLEKNGYIVIDVSSFQSFGGRTFYNIHLWTEGGQGSYNVNFENLNEVLLSLLQEQKQMLMQMYS